MRQDGSPGRSGVLAVAGILGGGVLAVAMLLAFVGGYLLVMLFWATVVLVLMALGLTTGIQRMAQPLQRLSVAAVAGPECDSAIVATGAAVAIRVVGVQGTCPLGLRMNDVFTVSP